MSAALLYFWNAWLGNPARTDGVINITEAADTFAATVLSGKRTAVIAATDAQDVFYAIGANTQPRRTSTIAFTEAFVDSLSATVTVVPVPPPPPPSPAEILAFQRLQGAGASRSNPPSSSKQFSGKYGGQTDYVPVTNEFWDARERYLRSLFPEEPEPAPPPEDLTGPSEANERYLARQQQLEQAVADRQGVISNLRLAETIEDMKRYGSRISALNDKIADLTGKQAFHRFSQDIQE